MQYLSRSKLPSFDVSGVTDTIERALSSAGLDTTAGPMRNVTETIRRALSSGGLPETTVPPGALQPSPDVVARVIDPLRDRGVAPRHAPRPLEPEAPGSFVSQEFSNAAGTRSYKVYVPARLPAAPMPIVVMLHGCTQSADDFAAGTRMNRLADEHGFLVVYPEQSAQANPSRCWNWFKSQDQVRDSGEPSLIAGLVREVAARHGADLRRVFVAGLSAGAAMAVVLGETYPELFAGVGVHSGLPYGSAHDIPSALAAMKGGRGQSAHVQNLPGAAPPRRPLLQALPMIVFHGDRDHTVQQVNAEQIVEQARKAHAGLDGAGLRTQVEHGIAPGGRGYSRTLFLDAGGRAAMESWTLHGAGHAWSGGDASGSYTDAKGPDASAEMIRFFLLQPRAGSA